MPEEESQRFGSVFGSERTLVPGSQPIGPVDPNSTIEVTIRLRPRTSADLGAAVDALGATPPAQRTYLTPDQYTAQFGADPSAVEKVTQFAAANQLTVVRSDLAQRNVVLSGSAAAIQAAFKVQLMMYSSPQGTYRGRVGPVQLPASIRDVVEGVFGLDNRQQARPHIVMPPRNTQAQGGNVAVLTATRAAAQADAKSFLPPAVGQFYNFPANLTGEGQCIGILEFGGGFAQSDLEAYFQQLNMPAPKVDAVSVDGVSNQPGKDPDSDGEVMLDIEIAAALAPGAKIVVYFAPFTEQGWVDAITTAVHDTAHKPSVLSISWGYTEGQDIWTAQAVQSVNQAFQAAAVLGMTICCASGDDGSQDQLADGQAHVDFPASSPYVLACGGTSFQFSGDQITGEAVWNNGTRTQGGGATGGGISDMNALPSWQQGIVPPSINQSKRVGRGVPDVAGDADERSGYTIQVDGQVISGVGGTSAVSPMWAALIARINQQLGKPVGYINPLLYSQLGKSGAFHDITSGNNDVTGQIGGYPAGAGWDACTGWGSPDGTKLMAALTSAAPGGTVPAPGPVSPVTPGGDTSDPLASVTGGNGALVTMILIVVLLLLILIAAVFALPTFGIHFAGL